MFDWSFLRNPEFWAAVFAVLVILVSKVFPDWAETFRDVSPLIQVILLFIFGAVVVSAYIRVKALQAGYVLYRGKWQKVS